MCVGDGGDRIESYEYIAQLCFADLKMSKKNIHVINYSAVSIYLLNTVGFILYFYVHS